jgi:hypothetical protein
MRLARRHRSSVWVLSLGATLSGACARPTVVEVHSGPRRHERAMLSICDAMGVTSFKGFGDPMLPAASKVPLAGLAA